MEKITISGRYSSSDILVGGGRSAKNSMNDLFTLRFEQGLNAVQKRY